MKTNLWWLVACALTAACGSDGPSLEGALGRGSRSDDDSPDAGPRKDGGNDGGSSRGEDDVCGEHSVRSDKAVPDMLIVLDRSGSMAPNGNDNGTNRWAGSAEAVTELTNNYGAGVNFGLMTFPGVQSGGGGGGGWGGGWGGGDDDDEDRQCAPGTLNVEVGPDNGDAIQQAISDMGPGGYTPTAATLEAALEVIGSPSYTDQQVTAPKFVLLVTDGDPNCSADWSGRGGIFGGGSDATARTDTIAAIEKLTAAGVSTFVVGYETANTEFAGQLDMMAAAGGTGETTHRSVGSAQDLAAVFEELAATATECSYRLSEKVTANFVLVTVGGKPRALGNADDGWKLGPDERTVILTGAACDAVKKGAVFTVDVSCEEIAI